MTANKHLEITEDNYNALKAAYELAVEEQQRTPLKDSFEHNGQLFYIPFVKYMLEHMRNELGITHPNN